MWWVQHWQEIECVREHREAVILLRNERKMEVDRKICLLDQWMDWLLDSGFQIICRDLAVQILQSILSESKRFFPPIVQMGVDNN